MNIVIVFPSLFTETQTLAKVIKKVYRQIKAVNIQDECIICETNNVVEVASELSKMFGVEKVAIATRVSSNFSDISDAIVETGSKILSAGDRFYVKVLMLPVANFPYRTRDIEFACTGTLAARLASIDALPAKTEAEANRVILTVVGKNYAYTCINMMRGPGGLVTGSRGVALGSIYSSLSFISCMMVAKGGFDCTSIVLPYVDDSDLEINAKLAQLFAIRTGRKRQTILATPIKVPAKGYLSLFLKEKIISKILIQCQGKVITFPLAMAVHPIWFVKSIIQDAVLAGKTPITPMISLSSELGNYAKEVGIDLTISAPNFTNDKLLKYSSTIESETQSAMKHMKKLDLKVGPNYLHDVIDSI